MADRRQTGAGLGRDRDAIGRHAYPWSGEPGTCENRRALRLEHHPTAGQRAPLLWPRSVESQPFRSARTSDLATSTRSCSALGPTSASRHPHGRSSVGSAHRCRSRARDGAAIDPCARSVSIGRSGRAGDASRSSAPLHYRQVRGSTQGRHVAQPDPDLREARHIRTLVARVLQGTSTHGTKPLRSPPSDATGVPRIAERNSRHGERL
jgi:hypothetical protein